MIRGFQRALDITGSHDSASSSFLRYFHLDVASYWHFAILHKHHAARYRIKVATQTQRQPLFTWKTVPANTTATTYIHDDLARYKALHMYLEANPATAVRNQALPMRDCQLFNRTDNAAFGIDIRDL